MKLSYREKIGLLIFIVAIVIIIFIAVPIKNIRKNIETHTTERDTVKVEYDEKMNLINEIPVIENNIKTIYSDTKGLSEKFIAHTDNINFDKYFEELLNKEPYMKQPKNTLEIVNNFNIVDAETGTIDFYYYVPNILTYPILEAADTNGNLMETSDKVLYDKAMNAVAMGTLEPQDVEIRQVSVPMKFTKESLLALEDELKEKETGVRITAVTIDDYTFGALSDIPEGATENEDKDYSEGEVTFVFYTMQQIQEPKFD